MKAKLQRLQEVRVWEEQRNHLCNMIAWEGVFEQQRVIDGCEEILIGSAKERENHVSPRVKNHRQAHDAALFESMI